MKASISATRSSSIVIVTRCIVFTIRRREYDELLLTSYFAVLQSSESIKARLTQRRYRNDRAKSRISAGVALMSARTSGRGVSRALRRLAWRCRQFDHRMLNRTGTTKDNSLVCTWHGGLGIGWARVSIASDSCSSSREAEVWRIRLARARPSRYT